MPNWTDFRAQHPEYDDMDDRTLLMALHKKYYSDIPVSLYLKQMGYALPEVPDVNTILNQASSAAQTTNNTAAAASKSTADAAALAAGQKQPSSTTIRAAAEKTLPINLALSKALLTRK